MSFNAAERPFDERQQTEHDQAKAEIVGFGQRVQARQRVGKAQQSDRAGQEEQGAAGDRDAP